MWFNKKTSTPERFWDAAPDAYLFASADLKLAGFNAAAERLFGCELAPFMGHPLPEMLGDAAATAADFKRVIDQQAPTFLGDIALASSFNFNRRLSLKVFPVDTGLGIIAVDVTEFRVIMDEAVRFSRFLQHVVGSANVCVHVIDANLNTIIWNAAAARLTGYAATELLGNPEAWLRLYPDEIVRADMVGRLEDVLKGRPATGWETRVTGADTSTKTISWHWQRIVDDDAVAIGCIGIGIDVSQRRDLENQLVMSQKMESLGTLAGGVAHDFNNLLTVIFGNTDLALGGMVTDDPNKELLEEILSTARRATSLTRQLLLFSRKQSGISTVINLNDTIKGLQKMLARLLKADIHIQTELDAEVQPVLADEGHLEQLLLNLCINARDAMPQGGRLYINTQNVSLTPIDCVSMPQARPGEFICLTVRDEGTGIAPENLTRIFEPFFTTKGPDKGTGLGLAVVYGVVKQLEGWILVDSELGRGTIFSVYLPAYDVRNKSALVESVCSRLTDTKRWRGHGETVLLVEDERAVNRTLERALTECGFQVSVADNLAAARTLLEHSEKPFAMIVSDIVLPDGNGLDLIRQVDIDQQGIRVLIITGYADFIPDLSQGVPLRVRLLQKPFSLDLFLDTIRDMFEVHRRNPTGMTPVGGLTAAPTTPPVIIG